MAKATANCKCATCGAEFTRTKTCQNRSDANSWEAWAEDHFDECPTCYGARKRAEEEAKPVSCRMSVAPYQATPGVEVVFMGNTKPIKDQLKSIGCRWSSEYSTGGVIGAFGLGLREPPKRWVLHADITPDKAEEQIDALFAKIDSLGLGIQIEPMDEAEMLVLHHRFDAAKAEADEKASKLAQLGDKPKRPEWMRGKKWNGKRYGKNEDSVYLDGERKYMSAAEIAELDAYEEAYAAWSAKRKELGLA